MIFGTKCSKALGRFWNRKALDFAVVKASLSPYDAEMALKATIFKVKLSLSNLNLHYYNDYALTIARHPSENNLRMMARLLAYILTAHEENLQFTKGISTDSEPDIWKINHDGSVDHWIELGHLDERRIRQISSKAKKASIYTYQGNQSLQWFASIENSLSRFNNLTITHLSFPEGQNIEDFVERGMNVSCTVEDNEVWLSTDEDRICVTFTLLKK
jgi:uncharacterized protein YaeQ